MATVRRIAGTVTSSTKPQSTNTGVPTPPRIQGTVTSATPPAALPRPNAGVPAMTGYGGVNYGDLGYSQQRQMDNQRSRELNDPAYRESEIARTQQVIAERQAQGLDTTAQYKYLNENLGYVPPERTTTPTPPPTPVVSQPVPSMPNVSQFTPSTPSQGVSETIETPPPANPVRDQAQIAAYVQEQIRASLEAARSAADRTIDAGRVTADRQTDALRTAHERMMQDVSEDRTLQDAQFDRLNNPFSGATDFRAGIRDFGRERTDREAQQDLQTREAQIQQDLAILERDIEEKYRLLETAAPAERERLTREIENEERAYEMMLRGENRADVMANLGIDESLFNRELSSFQTNRGIFESDRAFDYQRERDQVEDAYRDWENRFRYGQATGQFANNQQTLDMQRFLADNAYRQQAFNRSVLESDRDFASQESQRMFQNQFALEQFDRPYEQLTAAQRQQANQFSQTFAENVRQFGIDHAMRQAQLSNQIDNQTWNQYMDERRFDMELEAMQLRQDQASGREVSISDYAKLIDESPYIRQDTREGRTDGQMVTSRENQVTDQAGLADYILSIRLDDVMTEQLLRLYGLPTEPEELRRLTQSGETN